jgi:hypothetical protein
MRWMSPGIVLAVLFVLMGAQVTRLLAPGRGSYPWTLVLASGGVVAGEVLAAMAGWGGPQLGPLHPLPDAGVIALLELLGAQIAGARAA